MYDHEQKASKHVYCVVSAVLAKPDIHRANTTELQILIEMQKA